ncbi:MAG: type III pantothenate kinase [Flavobacteriaceae bacterium]|nr:MAG: type III pantothenate kinase [Flavobacteriaceae bacterium]
MNLVIDVGNTRVKAAVFKGIAIVWSISFDHHDIEIKIKELKKKYPVSRVMLSKVTTKISTEIKNILESDFFIELSNTTPVPFKNVYNSPKTLGIDRIALAAAAVEKYPDTNVLIIDAGTCITFDFVSSKKAYTGGAISPGVQMRYKALHEYTDALPNLKPEYSANLTGTTTKEAIHIGVLSGVVKEIEGTIHEYKMKYSDLTVVLTGGDTNFLAKQLKSSIFANQNFLLEGLNSILIFNTNT